MLARADAAQQIVSRRPYREDSPMSDHGKAVMLVTVDLDPADGAELVEWYDDEHIPAVMGERGYRSARRFRADGDPSRYLVVYELDESAVALRPPADPAEVSDRGKAVMAKRKSSTRAVWEEFVTSDTSSAGNAVLVITIEIDPADDEEFNRWYDEEHFAEKLAEEGCLSGRRFRLHDDPSRYLVLYQLDEAASATKPEYINQELSAWSKDMMSRWKDWSRSVWTEV
jgi:hypothetical protein